MWEGVGDRTELQYIDPHSYGHQRCVFLVLQGCLNGDPRARLSAECWLSLPQLFTNGSGLQTNWLPVFTELYNSPIAHSISPHNWPSGCVTSAVLGMACFIVIERKLLSCSSQTTLFRCISLIVPWDFTLSHIVSQARLRKLNMQLPRLWNGMSRKSSSF